MYTTLLTGATAPLWLQWCSSGASLVVAMALTWSSKSVFVRTGSTRMPLPHSWRSTPRSASQSPRVQSMRSTLAVRCRDSFMYWSISARKCL